jgi:hypothetical protein
VQKDRMRCRLGTPIGLKKSSSVWINAWAQFILYLPKFSELISFAEKSFAPFAEFVEQYTWDQKEGKTLSFADSDSLIRCLFHHDLEIDAPNFYVLFRSFFTAMFPVTEELGCFFHDSIVFHPEWVWDKIEEDVSLLPVELVVVGNKNMPRQFRLKGKYLYDLDMLVERSFDEKRSHFVTYVRVDGAWYQCEDEKVRWISSRTLSFPLNRGVLFHYKRVIL